MNESDIVWDSASSDIAWDSEKKKKKGDISVGEDVGKAAASALPKLAVGMAGLPMDLSKLIAAGRGKLMSVMPDFVQRGDAAVRSVAMPNPVETLATLPGSQEFRGAIEQATGIPWYDPKTRLGKATDTAIQTGALMGRGLLTAPGAAIVGGVTAGTEAAGALTNDDPFARAGGGLLGGFIPAAANVARSRVGAVVRDALDNPTSAQINEAIALQERAKAAGVPLMGTEAMDRGHQLASAVYASPAGNQTIETFLRNRPSQVGEAVKRELIAKTGTTGTPAENAALAQQTATDVIRSAEQRRSAAVSPYYRAAEFESIPPQAMRPVAQAIQNQIFASPVGSAQERALGGWHKQAFPYEPEAPAATVTAIPETNVGRLNQLYKNLGTEADVPTIGATPEQKISSYPAGQVREALGEVLKQNNPNIAKGQRLYETFSRNVIDPLKAGPVGRLATPQGFDPKDAANVSKVMASVADADSVRPVDIRTLYQKLNSQDRQAFPGIVQTHLENRLDAALTDIRSGPLPTAGAKFRNAIYGSPQQRENFDEMMRGVAQARGANPGDVVSGAHKFLEVLDRTGRTPGLGSPTQPRAEISKEMGKTLVGDTLNTMSLMPTRPLARRFDDWIARARYADVAKVLTAPDSVQLLAKMAKLEPNGLTARYYAAVLLGFGQATGTGQ